jgi:hypothetical protein
LDNPFVERQSGFSLKGIQTMKREFIQAGVMVHGIKGRDRSVKFHQHTLGEFAPDALDKEKLKQDAIAWVSRNVKQPQKARLTFLKGEAETIDGIEFKTLLLNFNLMGNTEYL